MQKLWIALFISLSCAVVSASSDLKISVNPLNPILIPKAAPVGTKTSRLLAPFFAVNNLSIAWKGNKEFELLAIVLTSKADPDFICGGSGPDLNYAYFSQSTVTDCNGNLIGNAIKSDGNVAIPGVAKSTCGYETRSNGFYCEKLNVPINPNPYATYSIPVTAVVTGQIVDENGRTVKKVTATQDIVIQ